MSPVDPIDFPNAPIELKRRLEFEGGVLYDKSRIFENFERALTKLEGVAPLPVSTERNVAGVIQAFEFTYNAEDS